jgi:hypothetical protein
MGKTSGSEYDFHRASNWGGRGGLAVWRAHSNSTMSRVDIKAGDGVGTSKNRQQLWAASSRGQTTVTELRPGGGMVG